MGFADATALTPAGDGRWTGQVHEGWSIAGNANGGYLLSMVVRAMQAESGRPDPASVTGHFLRPGKVGPVEARSEVVKAGSRFSTAIGSLWAADRQLLQVIGSFCDLADRPGDGDVERVEGTPPDLPPVEQCTGFEPSVGAPEFMGSIDLRLHPDDQGFLRGTPSGEARVRGWFRLRDEEAIDSVGLVLATDAFPPTIFNAGLPVGWTPTLELTTHVRARAEPGWLACSFTTRFVTGGFLEVDGEAWDAGGRLVAQSRQLALVPRTDPTVVPGVRSQP